MGYMIIARNGILCLWYMRSSATNRDWKIP